MESKLVIVIIFIAVLVHIFKEPLIEYAKELQPHINNIVDRKYKK